VLGADVAVGEHSGFFLRQYDDSAGSIRKPFKHVRVPRSSGSQLL